VLQLLYNLACVAVRVGERERALGYLERWFEGGGLDPGMPNDPDLEPLHGEVRYQAVAARMRGAGGK
jgi:hypothetical protein